MSLSNLIESNVDAEDLIKQVAKDQKRTEQLCMFLKEASGEDYTKIIKQIVSKM